MRTTSPRRLIIVSISPGPWWLKPLWSLRQQVEVRRTLSEATGARHSSRRISSSHFACWIAIEAETIAKAS
jgi:hypothetical protein